MNHYCFCYLCCKTNYPRDRNSESLAGWISFGISQVIGQMSTGVTVVCKFNWTRCPRWLVTWLVTNAPYWLTRASTRGLSSGTVPESSEFFKGSWPPSEQTSQQNQMEAIQLFPAHLRSHIGT